MNPRTLTPVPATIIVAVVIALLAGLLPIDFLAEMTSIGTLVAFLVVSIGVIVLRQTAPDLPRGFKVPGYPVTPILSIARLLLDHQGPARGHDLRLLRLVAVALLWYFFYGIKHSHCSGKARRARRRHDAASSASRPTGAGAAVLHWPAMLARSADDDLVVCAVVPAAVAAGPGARRRGVPARSSSSTAQRRARPGARAAAGRRRRDFVVQHARSAPAGLLEVAEEHDAAPDRAGLLVHGRARPRLARQRQRPAGAQLAAPVALAPRGFRCQAGVRGARA